MTIACIIVAAGTGQRAGPDLPKQYRPIGGKAVLTRTIAAILAEPSISTVLCVIHPDHAAFYAHSTAGIDDQRLIAPVLGGADRQASVRAGLERLKATDPDIVLIHDAARPFLPRAVIARVIEALSTAEAAFPALPMEDTIWQSTAGRLQLADRAQLHRAQTPQGFKYRLILAAHHQFEGVASDDIAVALAADMSVAIVQGAQDNFKITTPKDFARAERIIGMDVRTGNGFDVHAFTEGSSVTLCGVAVPFTKSLLGHSDADVAMHAITDAILGAMAEGDIGTWFPPSQEQWRGANSRVFLAKAMEICAQRNMRCSHIDCTIICEAPKIGPHAMAMRQNIGEICGLDITRVSVKATTTERLGFAGRGEGIAAMATATLCSI